MLTVVLLAATMAPAAAASDVEQTIADEAAAIINYERAVLGLEPIPAGRPEEARSIGAATFSRSGVTSAALVVESFSHVTNRRRVLDLAAIGLVVTATCEGNLLSLRIEVSFRNGEMPPWPEGDPITDPRSGTSCTAQPDSPAPAPSPTVRDLTFACPAPVTQAGFDDTAGNAHETAINCVTAWKIASGRTAHVYDPSGPVTREQMATFIVRYIDQTADSLPAATRDWFHDDNGSAHESAINRLAEARLVTGASTGYNPADPVTRAQMATFLVRAYEDVTGTDLAIERDWFTDDDGQSHEAAINKAASAGLTGGSGSGYSPAGTVTRAQMASFLARLLDLTIETGHIQAR